MSATATRGRAATRLLLLAPALLSCSGGAAPPQPSLRALGGEVAARVGSELIPLAAVTLVATAQKLPPRDAMQRLVDDAVAADAARARGLDRARGTAWLLTSARGRATADHLLAEARQAGPPTDPEIAALTEQHWREVDRPVAVRVVHALAQRPKGPDPSAEQRARDVAEQLRGAVAAARDPDDFVARAKAVPHPGVDVVAQPLPAFTAEGLVSEGPGTMDAVFARAAHGLSKAGDTSGVVETPFGWHVIRLVERVPEQRMPLETRRLAFAEEVYVRRARASTLARLEDQRVSAPVTILASAENLMRSVSSAGAGPAP